MALATVFQKNNDDLSLKWSGRWSLTTRILAVNIFAIAMLAGSVYYLDTFRERMIEERLDQIGISAEMAATALVATPVENRPALASRISRINRSRIRVYAPDGHVIVDSWRTTGPTYHLRDPSSEPLRKHAARFLDQMIDLFALAPKLPEYTEPATDRRDAWPEARQALASSEIARALRNAPDRTPMVSAAAKLPGEQGAVLLMTASAREVTRTFRAERLSSAIIIAIVIATSILLSFFLARTIVRPLRRLAIAAQRVRAGRAREVVVPRLPSRRDEIGLLARALSDMSQALRQRIDATEAFAADVTHELKNPLASLRSAVEALERIDDPGLRNQLLEVVRNDVHRLDRLITDIAEASRLDAELSRTRFEPIDLGQMIAELVNAREIRGMERNIQLAFARPEPGTAVVMGEENRLTRVIENLIDNAISFSPDDGLIQISATRDGDRVQMRIDDEGPGVPPEAREAIFRRFHSVRPEGEAFGKHSGLGLAIAKATIEAHDGTIIAEDRADAESGARFTVTLPAVEM